MQLFESFGPSLAFCVMWWSCGVCGCDVQRGSVIIRVFGFELFVDPASWSTLCWHAPSATSYSLAAHSAVTRASVERLSSLPNVSYHAKLIHA